MLSGALSGALWINKPQDLTSSDVVVRLKIALTKNGYCTKGFKIGHGGTLDPFATGALIILVGEATKLADTYLHSIKSYSGTITLGERTDTADLTGAVVESKPVPKISESDWQAFANTFTDGEYLQTPPMYSAKKIDGKALHELARQGKEVDRKAILKKIHSFTVKKISEKELSFEIKCESGTYVRVIAEDLAKKAGTVAHLKTLVRTQTSDVSLEKCFSLESVQGMLGDQLPVGEIKAFYPMEQVATHLPSLRITEVQAQDLLRGSTQAIHLMSEQIASVCISAKYGVARLKNGTPIALFERTSEVDSVLKPSYRLQRVILWQ